MKNFSPFPLKINEEMFPTFFFFLFPQCSGNIFFLHWILFFFLSSSLSFGINNEFQKFFYSIQFLDSRHESKHTHIWNKSFLACFLNTKKKILILNFKLFVLFWLLKRKKTTTTTTNGWNILNLVFLVLGSVFFVWFVSK